jgi:hypothetical protein
MTLPLERTSRFFISAAGSARAGIAALTPVGSAPTAGGPALTIFPCTIPTEGGGWPTFMIFACTVPTEGAPSLRFLQGWATVLRALFDFCWLPSSSRRNIFTRLDDMGGQQRLRKILRIQCHDEIGPASFSATTEGIVARIGRDARQSGGRNKFRLLPQQIDYLSDEWTPDTQPFQDSLVLQKNLIAHQPDKRIPFDPVPE